jgi:hypothetical protein
MNARLTARGRERIARQVKDSKVANYYLRQMDDPRVERMIDFKAMPISHWPSIEVYHAFNEYYFSSIMLMENVGERGHVN